jgi:hypothetical protein
LGEDFLPPLPSLLEEEVERVVEELLVSLETLAYT